MADYTAADGSRKRVSTKQESKEGAKQFLASLIAGEKLGRDGRLTEDRARELIAEIYERTTGERLEFFTVRKWFQDWLAVTAVSKSFTTVARYRTVVDSFLKFLGPRADKPIETLRTVDIAGFFKAERDAGKSCMTCALSVRVLKASLTAATKRAGLKQSPADGFEIPKEEGDSVEREIFTAEDVNSLIAAASGDWPGVIRLSYFTGMRLGDCVNLQWGAVDLGRKVIEFIPSKTAKRVRPGGKSNKIAVPLHPQLEAALSAMTGADGSPDAHVFPLLAGRTSGGRSGLSLAFSRIMEKAGVDAGVRRKKTGATGRTGRARTFHSLRHTFITALGAAGVSLEHRKLLAGHTEEAMTERYSHTEVETLRAGVDRLPGLG
jgi:integrase